MSITEDKEYQTIIEKINTMDALGFSITELQSDILEAFQHMDGEARHSRKEVTNKWRAERVISILLRRLVLPEKSEPAQEAARFDPSKSQKSPPDLPGGL